LIDIWRVYSSLDKIDAVTPAARYQTDHRTRAEIEDAPELSVLFALTRICNARRHNDAASEQVVVYVPKHELPGFLEEAVAAAGGVIEDFDRGVRHAPTHPASTAAELADRAFQSLAARVCRRLETSDLETALRALEAEIAASPPRLPEDEVGYWTGVCELSALTGEILRARCGGAWVDAEHSVVPFGFSHGAKGALALPSNRAQRCLEDGPSESMFHVIAGVLEMQVGAPSTGPVLPSLRTRDDAIALCTPYRPLFDGADRFPDLPVIIYGRDTPATFAMLRATGDDDMPQLHAEALRNLAAQGVSIETLELHSATVVTVEGSFYAAEKLLDTAFMQTLHARFGELIAASVPRRGLLLVTTAADAGHLAALAIATEREARGSRRLGNTIVLVEGGAIVGLARASDAPRAADASPASAKKPGWLRRLFGRNESD
jgi:hypothetical protein